MNEVGHIPTAYPSVEDAMHSAQHLLKMAVGSEEAAASHVGAHSWIVVGTGLSQVLPLDRLMQAKANLVLTAEEREQLENFVAMKADDKARIDWKSLLKTILPLILKLLICLAVVVCFSATAGASAPRPPQAPPIPAEFLALDKVKPETCKCTCKPDECKCCAGCCCGGKAKHKAAPEKQPAKKTKKVTVQRYQGSPGYLFMGQRGNCASGTCR